MDFLGCFLALLPPWGAGNNQVTLISLCTPVVPVCLAKADYKHGNAGLWGNLMEIHQGYPEHWFSPSKVSLALQWDFPTMFPALSKLIGVNKTAINLSA